jgi:hypothetical protein
MVDIETLDTQISAAIVSIGAVVFDPRGEDYQETFSLTIDEKSNRWHGRTVSDATLEWWAHEIVYRLAQRVVSDVYQDMGSGP